MKFEFDGTTYYIRFRYNTHELGHHIVNWKKEWHKPVRTHCFISWRNEEGAWEEKTSFVTCHHTDPYDQERGRKEALTLIMSGYFGRDLSRAAWNCYLNRFPTEEEKAIMKLKQQAAYHLAKRIHDEKMAVQNAGGE